MYELVIVLIWGIFFAIFLLPFYFIRKAIKLAKEKYMALPTLDDYLKKHPKAKTKHGIACAHCNSKNLKNLGFSDRHDPRRMVSCNSCGEPLYRLHRKL